MSKNWGFGETGGSYDQKLVFSDNTGQNIWNKLNEFSKIRLD